MNLLKSVKGFLPGLSDLFGSDRSSHSGHDFSLANTSLPSLNVREAKDGYKVELIAPGMDKSDFKISLEGNTLNIVSHKEFKQEKTEDNYRRREFCYQSFKRSLVLPKGAVEADRIKAKYSKGVLVLNIPKTEEAKNSNPKVIEIN